PLAIDIAEPCAAWRRACPEAASVAAAAARLALARTAARTPIVVDITLTDDGDQQAPNRTYRGHDMPTHVLSFPRADPEAVRPPGMPLLLGDVVLAYETVAREAAEQEKPLADHHCHLVVHGVLHLLGYDHHDEDEAATMEAREIAILAELGVPNPYR